MSTLRTREVHTDRVDARAVAMVVDELLAIVQSGAQDLDWQPWYEDERQLVDDLRDHAERARRGDDSRLPELKFLLAPTSALNEIAFSSGWGRAYVRLANEFDRLYPGPSKPPPWPYPHPPQ